MTKTSLLNTGESGCSLFMSSDPDSVPVLSLIGEVDLSNAPRIYTHMWQTSQKGAVSVILNLEQLDFMDSSGLQVLLRLREKLRTRKQDVLLVGAKPQIKKLLKLTGFDRLFSLHETNASAKLFIQDGQAISGDGQSPLKLVE